MSMSDPIADLLTRIRNSLSAKHSSVSLPSSKMKASIVAVLKNEGYISDFEIQDIDGKPLLVISLKYYLGKPVIEKINRVSKPGLRVYRGKDELPQVLGGLGISIISTSSGVLSDRQAKKLGVGGEIICTVE
jgi:small subunit ribosomal protein S8